MSSSHPNTLSSRPDWSRATMSNRYEYLIYTSDWRKNLLSGLDRVSRMRPDDYGPNEQHVVRALQGRNRGLKTDFVSADPKEGRGFVIVEIRDHLEMDRLLNP